jgi:hypothetical protein
MLLYMSSMTLCGENNKKNYNKVSLEKTGYPERGYEKSLTTEHVYLVVFQQLRPLLLVGRGDQVALHVERHWVQVNCPDKLEAFKLS